MKFCILILFLLNSLLAHKVIASEEVTVYIFPGYGSSTHKELYQKIGAEYLKKGIMPRYIDIDWSTDDISNYIEQAKEAVSKNSSRVRYFYGFSLGGLIALSLSVEDKTESVMVSSISPFFKEDIDALSWYSPHKFYNWWLFGNSNSVSANEIISELNKTGTQATLFVGSEEFDVVINRSKILANSLESGDLVFMNGVAHGLSKPGHMEYIIREIQYKVPDYKNQ